jgi:hypothetical protein
MGQTPICTRIAITAMARLDPMVIRIRRRAKDVVHLPRRIPVMPGHDELVGRAAVGAAS